MINRCLTCLSELKNNSNIDIDNRLSQMEVIELDFILDFILNDKNELRNEGIEMRESHYYANQLAAVSVAWKSKLPLGDLVLKGGFVFNGVSDALLIPSDFWKGGVSLAPDVEIPNEYKAFEKLGWFQKNPDGLSSRTGCFIKQEGEFPPPIAFYSGGGWYTNLDFGFEKYLELLFENYGFLGWQFFYIDIANDIPRLDDVLEDMRIAVKTMPLLFPDKDWSYHINRYDETLKILGKI